MDGETMETVTYFIFLSSKITADGDCNHEIKRHMLLGRKVITNLDSILKSRDITLPTKACLVKAMVFPVIMYGCKSWTIKKAECRRSALWCWRRLLRVPWTARVNPKGNQSWKCIGRTDAEDKTPFVVHLMWRTDSLEKTLMLGKTDGRKRREWQKMIWLDGIANWIDMSLSKLLEVVMDRESWCTAGRGSQRVRHYWEVLRSTEKWTEKWRV